MCSGLAVVIFRLVAALNHGALGGIARLRRVALGRVAPDDLARRRRIWLGLAVAALHDLGLNVAWLDHGLDHGRRVDDGGRIRELGLTLLLVLLDEHRLFPPAHEDADAARDAAANDDEDDEDDRKRFRGCGLVVLVLARDEHVVAG